MSSFKKKDRQNRNQSKSLQLFHCIGKFIVSFTNKLKFNVILLQSLYINHFCTCLCTPRQDETQTIKYCPILSLHIAMEKYGAIKTKVAQTFVESLDNVQY